MFVSSVVLLTDRWLHHFLEVVNSKRYKNKKKIAKGKKIRSALLDSIVYE
jgi:hypothetical protein